MVFSKSQRVKVIQDLSTHLASEEWNSIDLVLKQFKLPWSDQWSGDKSSYVMEMIGNAEDSELVELAEHYGMQIADSAGAETAAKDMPYWKEGQLKVFLSHLTTERQQAANIQTALENFGMSAFVAHNDINPTAEWQVEIETALATCDLLVAIIHPKFVESKWCDQEIGYALGRGIPVFTVRCGEDPHGFVSRFQAFNGNGKSPFEIAKEIFEAAIEHKKLQAKMAGILVDLFVNSGSFATAKTRISYLEKLKVWDKSYSLRISKAVGENSQIEGSWGVPEQVEALVDKWK